MAQAKLLRCNCWQAGWSRACSLPAHARAGGTSLAARSASFYSSPRTLTCALGRSISLPGRPRPALRGDHPARSGGRQAGHHRPLFRFHIAYQGVARWTRRATDRATLLAGNAGPRSRSDHPARSRPKQGIAAYQPGNARGNRAISTVAKKPSISNYARHFSR